MNLLNENELLDIVARFNNSGNPTDLSLMPVQGRVKFQEFIKFGNTHIDHAKLAPLRFFVLKLSDNYLIYIDEEGRFACSDLEGASLMGILNTLKEYCKESSAGKDNVYTSRMRTVLMIAAKGLLKSYDVYTNIDTRNLSKSELKKLIEDDAVWIRERIELHNSVLNKRLKCAQYLSGQIDSSDSLGRGIYCTRGTVASGKSTFVRELLFTHMPGLKDTNGVIDTDSIKRLLAEESYAPCGVSVSAYLFHDEASMISRRLVALVEREGLSYFIDKRMQEEGDLRDLIEGATRSDLSVTIFDFKSSFLTSALRVLRRTGRYPSDPTPDFQGLIKSYNAIEKSREVFYSVAISSSRVKDYCVVRSTIRGEAEVTYAKRDYKVLKDSASGFMRAELIDEDNAKNVMLSTGSTVKDALDVHSLKGYGRTVSREHYRDVLCGNIENTSRSYNGKLDLSASTDKQNKMNSDLSSAEVESISRDNIQEVFEFIYDNKNLLVSDVAVLRGFIDTVALIVNRGLIRDERYILRRGENSQKYNYVSTSRIEDFYEVFIKEFFTKLSDIDSDPIETACWVEWNIDFCGHIFSDGCGRIAKVISSWLLIRADMDLPDYLRGSEGFSSVRESYRKRFSIREEVKYEVPTEDKNYFKFLVYYKSLFVADLAKARIVAAGGLVYNLKGQFLILQSTKGKDAESWVLPGGKLEKNETPREAYEREVFEETGLRTQDIRLLGIRDYDAKSGNSYRFYDYVSTVSGRAEVEINSESSASRWISKERMHEFKFADSVRHFLNKHFTGNEL
jgi:8-oxo-dGTP pyrophosphatase MutT (NUDIX family)